MDKKERQRFFLSIIFFFAGICFATWASRIPTIKSDFGFNDAQLGTLLFSMPIASMIGLPISGFLVSRFNSRVPLIIGFSVHVIALMLISLAQTTYGLVSTIGLFAFSMRILNISMNTQALTLQNIYNKKINGSFHALWSTGGIIGVGFSTLMLSLKIPIRLHFCMVSAITFIAVLSSFRYLIKNDRAASGNKLFAGKPDPFIIYLGLLVFFSAVCEGGMFDWSGIYFKEIVKEEIFTSGYLIFMTFMAMSRFLSDKIIEKAGTAATYVLSSATIITGNLLAVLFPYFWPALIGFSMVGFGIAAIVPMTFTLAATSKKYSPGMAISIITTYLIAGMLTGPPLIGYLSHAFGLRRAFICFIVAGFMLAPVSQLFFRYVQKTGPKP